MAARSRCILLAGAPGAESLRWDEQHLLSDFQSPLKRYLKVETPTSQQSEGPTPTSLNAKWRSVAYDVAPHDRPTGIRHNVGDDNLEHQQFLEHSIAILDDLDASQIITSTPGQESNGDEEPETTFLSFSTSASFADSSFHTSFSPSPPALPAQKAGEAFNVKISGTITDLKQIPRAASILEIRPRTIIINLLVGIISISPARIVRLRRRDAEMDIIELTVGDETRAGFGITFWLAPIQNQQRHKDHMRESLESLRSADVLLLQNIALSCFRGNVYGQSLSTRFAQNGTSITLLGEDGAPSMPITFKPKLHRVQDWTSDFVGVARNRASSTNDGRNTKKCRIDGLPPDTQD